MSSPVALITGCSSGIGADLTQALTAAGYTVAASARRITDLAGLNCPLKLQLDVTSQSSADAAVAEVLRQTGRLDIVINNAGYAIRGAAEELDPLTVQSMFDVNLNGIIRMTRAAAPHMRSQGSGTIVNIGSIGGKLSMPFNGAYSGSKFAVEALTDAMRLELKPFGVKVILIEPGNIRTGFLKTAGRQSEQTLTNTASPYHSYYQNYLKLNSGLRKNEPGPAAVTSIVLKALRADKPKARYRAAVPFSTRLMLALNDGLRDALFTRVLKLYPPSDNSR